MAMSSKTRSLLAGLLVGNSAPHLGTAVAGREHMTPLAGRQSGPVVNGVWGVANLVGGLVLLRSATASTKSARWDDRLLWFEVGVAAFAAFMATSERATRMNTG